MLCINLQNVQSLNGQIVLNTLHTTLILLVQKTNIHSTLNKKYGREVGSACTYARLRPITRIYFHNITGGVFLTHVIVRVFEPNAVLLKPRRFIPRLNERLVIDRYVIIVGAPQCRRLRGGADARDT